MLNIVKHLALGLARDSARSFVSLRMTVWDCRIGQKLKLHCRP